MIVRTTEQKSQQAISFNVVTSKAHSPVAMITFDNGELQARRVPMQTSSKITKLTKSTRYESG